MKKSYLILIFLVIVLSTLVVNYTSDMYGSESSDQLLRESLLVCSRIEDKQARRMCLEKSFRDAVSYADTQFALDGLDRYMKESEGILSYCHPIAHAIGQTTFSQQENMAGAFAECNFTCASGCYHGIMERLLSVYPDFEARINTLCSDGLSDIADSYTLFQCFHGLGHGLMFFYGDDLFLSLDKCDLLDEKKDRFNCYGGVFMENIVIDEDAYPSKFLDRENPHYPCNAVLDQQKSACYFSHGDWLAKIYDYDFNLMFQECDAASDEYVDKCYESMGRVIGWYVDHDLQKTHEFCELGIKASGRSCKSGVISDLINTYNGIQEVVVFCTMADQDYRPDCYRTLGMLSPVLESSVEEQMDLCITLEDDEYVNACLEGVAFVSNN